LPPKQAAGQTTAKLFHDYVFQLQFLEREIFFSQRFALQATMSILGRHVDMCHLKTGTEPGILGKEIPVIKALVGTLKILGSEYKKNC